MKPTFKLRYLLLTDTGWLVGFVGKPQYCNDAWNTFHAFKMHNSAVEGELEPGELYELTRFSELTKVSRPVWIPADGEKVMVKDHNTASWQKAYSKGERALDGSLICYRGDKWLASGLHMWTFWRKPTQEELK